ncbi:MAG: Wadjet anti-phage system protein JetA family protein, partial [Spirochaetia bacterium]
DNLSKYRPRIAAAVRELLRDDGWKEYTAEKLSQIKRIPRQEAGSFLTETLKEIVDDLKSIDPILEEIDDKNRRYSRISTERIKARLYSSASIQGMIGEIVKSPAIEELSGDLPHGIRSFGFLAPGSLYSRRRSADQLQGIPVPETDEFAVELAQTELMLRIGKQLGPEKIRGFLETVVPDDGSAAPAGDIVTDMESYVRILYAAAYAETRTDTFPYRVRWEDAYITAGRFRFRGHAFFREAGDE